MFSTHPQLTPPPHLHHPNQSPPPRHHQGDEEFPRFYASGDAAVLPTRGEGWGRPHVEAMSMALPVIATNWCVRSPIAWGAWDVLGCAVDGERKWG